MFDYQAGEKYKLTLIMVGIAGLIAGMFFTLLLVPGNDMVPSKRRAHVTRAMMDPDVTGHRSAPSSETSSGQSGNQQGAGAAIAAPAQMVDRATAVQFMQNWLPRVWDLSAQTAVTDQEEAIKWMTGDCASAYRQNIWSADTARQVADSGLVSQFRIKSIDPSDNLSDGSVIVKVQGTQVLRAPAGQKSKDVSLEYMLKQTSEGIRVAGISEAGSRMQ